MSEPIMLYSVNSYLAWYINNNFYKGYHYVWCSPTFDCRDSEALFRTNPQTSNPKDIYNAFLKECCSTDTHLNRIAIKNNISGILNGVSQMSKLGKISLEDENKIRDIIKQIKKQHLYKEYFMPLLYLIPFCKVEHQVEYVTPSRKALPLSQELVITSLHKNYFDAVCLTKGGILYD